MKQIKILFSWKLKKNCLRLYSRVSSHTHFHNHHLGKVYKMIASSIIRYYQGGQKSWKNLEFDMLGWKNLELEKF